MLTGLKTIIGVNKTRSCSCKLKYLLLYKRFWNFFFYFSKKNRSVRQWEMKHFIGLAQNTFKIFWQEGKELGKHIFTLEHLRATRSLSATNSIYCFIRLWFIPMSFTGRASVRNSCSMTTASLMISLILSSDGLFLRYVNIKQAKSQWRPCVIDHNHIF